MTSLLVVLKMFFGYLFIHWPHYVCKVYTDKKDVTDKHLCREVLLILIMSKKEIFSLIDHLLT